MILNRHPQSVTVLQRLNTILCRIEIEQACVLDDSIGYFCVSADDYYNADVDE